MVFPAYSTIPVIKKVIVPEPLDTPPKYDFHYEVNDEKTGDQKSQTESRIGDVVKGSYSFIQPDGNRRIVEYTSDDKHGLNAEVRYEPVVVKKVIAAPITKIVAPAFVHHPIYHPTFHHPVFPAFFH